MRRIVYLLFKKDIRRFLDQIKAHGNVDRRVHYRMMEEKYGWSKSKFRRISGICIFCGLAIRKRV